MSEILGIVCTGGPAPGLNGVIAAATIYAHQFGWRVLGFQEGYRYLITGDAELVSQNILELTDELVIPISSQGGSILRTDRTDPTLSPVHLSNSFSMLKHFQIRYLLAIGGNEKIRSSHFITQGVDPTQMQVIAVPKTIANDVPLPPGQTSFGYHSARIFGTSLVKNLIVDSQSAPRWFIVETMGRHSGHLALSIAEASGADLAIIPEDFGDREISISDICDVFEASIIKKLSRKYNYGVCVISEGLINQLSREERESLYSHQLCPEHPCDLSLDDADISRVIRNEMNDRMKKRHLDIRVNPKKIGYELRGAAPVSFDSIYARELGVGAIDGFRSGHSNCVVIWNNSEIEFRSFRSLMDPISGRIKPRRVDTNSSLYRVSRTYMWILTRSDLENEEKLQILSKSANTTPEQFLADFGHVPALTV